MTTPSFTINAAELSKVLAIVNTAVEKKNTIPVLAFVLLEGNGNIVTITGTDLDTTIKLKIEGESKPGTAFCLPASQLQNCARLAPKGVATVWQDKERGMWECEGFTSKLLLRKKADFPECETVKGIGVKLPGATFARMLQLVIFAASENDYGKWASRSVNVALKGSKLELASTDGSGQIAATKVSVDSADKAVFLVGRQSVSALIAFALSELEVELASTKNHFGLIGAKGSISARLLTGKFPDYDKFIPETFPHTVAVTRDDLLLTLKRAAIGLDDSTVGTRWVISNSLLSISSQSHEREGLGTLSIDCPSLNGSEAILGLNGPMVLKFLAVASGAIRFSFIDASKPYRFDVDVDEFEYRYITTGINPGNY